jgi:hypothetical protein
MVYLDGFLGTSLGSYLATVVIALEYLEAYLLPGAVVLWFPTHVQTKGDRPELCASGPS